MSMQKLDLEGIAKIKGGMVAEAFKQEMLAIHNDITQRPAVKTARKITLQLEIRPLLDNKGNLEVTPTKFNVFAQLPKRQSVEVETMPTKTDFIFEEHSPEDVHQTGMDFDPKTGEVKPGK